MLRPRPGGFCYSEAELSAMLCDLEWIDGEVALGILTPAFEVDVQWKHRKEWFTFLSHPEVEATNWEAEQAIRPAVVNRKVWGGNRTWVGAHTQEVLMSVLGTCKRIGRSGLDFVSQTLRAFGNPQLQRPVLLTPR
jgi:transposase